MGHIKKSIVYALVGMFFCACAESEVKFSDGGNSSKPLVLTPSEFMSLKDSGFEKRNSILIFTKQQWKDATEDIVYSDLSETPRRGFLTLPAPEGGVLALPICLPYDIPIPLPDNPLDIPGWLMRHLEACPRDEEVDRERGGTTPPQPQPPNCEVTIISTEIGGVQSWRFGCVENNPCDGNLNCNVVLTGSTSPFIACECRP